MVKHKISIKARLILYNKGKILLLKQTKPNGGNYSLVGGTIEFEEFAKEALIRESYEEAGILLKAKDLTLVHVLQKNKKNEQRLVLYFKAKKWNGDIKTREPHKFIDAIWFPLNDLPKNMTSSVKQALVKSGKGILFSKLGQ